METCYLETCNGGIWEFEFNMADGVCVCAQWILRCKFRINNWKYVTVGVGRL